MADKDLLSERIELYNRLLDIEYKFYLGKKKKLRNVELIFTRSEFAHLIGLQYLKDKSELSNVSMENCILVWLIKLLISMI